MRGRTRPPSLVGALRLPRPPWALRMLPLPTLPNDTVLALSPPPFLLILHPAQLRLKRLFSTPAEMKHLASCNKSSELIRPDTVRLFAAQEAHGRNP